jgi:hypothetical protein
MSERGLKAKPRIGLHRGYRLRLRHLEFPFAGRKRRSKPKPPASDAAGTDFGFCQKQKL